MLFVVKRDSSAVDVSLSILISVGAPPGRERKNASVRA
jgi:hypothetical protein